MQVPSFATLSSGRLALGVLIVSAGLGVAPAGAQNPTPRPTLAVKPAPAADEVSHVVKKGDTLWDIAKAYLKDPFRWPEVFQRNTDIVENPHWIYPGETIRIPVTEVRPEVLARISTVPVPPSDRSVFSTVHGQVLDRIQSSGEVIGRSSTSGVTKGEIESAPFADRAGGPRGSGRLAASYDRPGIQPASGGRSFQIRDRVFVDLPRRGGAGVGELLMSYRLGPLIAEDAQVVIPTGVLRVESIRPGQPALATVVRQFGEIRLDQALLKVEPAVAVTGAAVAIVPGPSEQVVYVDNDPVLPSLQSYLILTAKAGNGVRVGDQFTLFDDTLDPLHPAPPVPAAVAEVVRVTPYAVTAIVVDHEQPTIRPGMTARLSARTR